MQMLRELAPSRCRCGCGQPGSWVKGEKKAERFVCDRHRAALAVEVVPHCGEVRAMLLLVQCVLSRPRRLVPFAPPLRRLAPADPRPHANLGFVAIDKAPPFIAVNSSDRSVTPGICGRCRRPGLDSAHSDSRSPGTATPCLCAVGTTGSP